MMKKSKLKSSPIWAILLIFVFTTMFSAPVLKVQAASDFVLSHSYDNILEQGDDFELPLNMRNLTNKTISNIRIDFSNSGIVALTNGATVYAVDDSISLEPSDKDVEICKIDLYFIGDGSKNIMPVTVTYNIEGEDKPKSATANLVLSVESDDDSGGSTPPVRDTSKYEPEFIFSVDDNLELSSGKTRKFKLNIKNINTRTSARNIVFSPIYKADSPFVSVKVLSDQPIKTLSSGKSTDIELSVETDKLIPDGIYPFTFLLSYTNSWNDDITPTEHTVYLKVINYQTNCNLKLSLPTDQNISAKAGGRFELPLHITNDGSLSAKDVRISIKELSQDTFMLSSGTGLYDFNRIFGNETRNLNYSLIVSEKIKTSSYPLTFVIEYKDEKEQQEKIEQQIWVPVKGSDSDVTMLEIVEIKPSATTVKSGEPFDVNVKVKNSGEFDSGQIKISADGTEALLPVAQNLHIIPNIKKDEEKNITFSFQPSYGAPRGGVPITIKVESVDSVDNISIAQAISVFLDSSSTGEGDKNIPKIIVKSYSSEPTLVNAGEEFTLNVQFLNTHSDKTVRNIKGNFVVTEESNETGSVFSPVGSSNTFYIDQITPKGTYDWDLTLYTIPDAKSKTYTVTISFEYEDDSGNPYKADEIIGIPVYQPSRFETSDISLPPDTFMGNPVYVYFEMYNMGKTDIYNVKLNVEGDFQAEPSSSYFGNFTPGYREYFEITLIPNMVGEAKGNLIFQYETASGEQQEYIKEISMNVMEMMMPPEGDFPVGNPMDPGMEDIGQENSGFIGSVWFYVIIGVVVIGVVLTIVLVRRKRKKSEEFDF